MGAAQAAPIENNRRNPRGKPLPGGWPQRRWPASPGTQTPASPTASMPVTLETTRRLWLMFSTARPMRGSVASQHSVSIGGRLVTSRGPPQCRELRNHGGLSVAVSYWHPAPLPCHAEGRGFESHHPLREEPAANSAVLSPGGPQLKHAAPAESQVLVGNDPRRWRLDECRRSDQPARGRSPCCARSGPSNGD